MKVVFICNRCNNKTNPCVLNVCWRADYKPEECPYGFYGAVWDEVDKDAPKPSPFDSFRGVRL